jgi:hypothetical protein
MRLAINTAAGHCKSAAEEGMRIGTAAGRLNGAVIS